MAINCTNQAELPTAIRNGKRPALTLEREGCWLKILPPTEVPKALSSLQHHMVNDPATGCQIAAKNELLCKKTPFGKSLQEIFECEGVENRNVTFSGLESPLRTLLEQAGYQVISRHVPAPLNAPVISAIPATRPADRPFLDRVGAAPNVLVRIGQHVEPAWLVAQMALAFPAASIVVGFHQRRHVRPFVDRIRQSLPEVGVAGRLRHGEDECVRVVAGNFASLGDGAVRLEHRDIVCLPFARDALLGASELPLQYATSARFVGFLPDHEQLAPREWDGLRCIFGFDDVHIPAHGMKMLPIDVVVESMRGNLMPSARQDVVQFRRAGVWRNPIRNRRIAALARSLQSGDWSRPEAPFPKTAAALTTLGPKRVLVVVDAIEHALQLAYRVGDWPLIAAAEIDSEDLAPADRQLLERMRAHPGGAGGQIATIGALDQLDLTHVDVVIRADAGVGDLPLPDRQLVVPNELQHRVLLIDFDDRNEPQMRRWSRGRRQAYHAREWFAPVTHPASVRVSDFLANRPR